MNKEQLNLPTSADQQLTFMDALSQELSITFLEGGFEDFNKALDGSAIDMLACLLGVQADELPNLFTEMIRDYTWNEIVQIRKEIDTEDDLLEPPNDEALL